MVESDWILPVLGLGGLAIGGLLILPKLKGLDLGFDDGGEAPSIAEQGMSALDLELEARRKLKELRELEEEEEERELETNTSRVPFLIGRQPDDAYVITDEDFDKLDIGKKDRAFLNRQRKLRDARLERVVYGDNDINSMMLPTPTISSYFVNTFSPYGQGPAREFQRLPNPEGLSRTNTRTNTVNLY